ncbi:unnamed protein product [Prorocentrum cordatum]|uniref:Uncharacterized protein n=1 Tax=Prorocentrum cordatum TaxID=2364126 RepID=A0ABN9RTZ5_9DINO|nr:unnamed protein product [Polarella glacialis]
MHALSERLSERETLVYAELLEVLGERPFGISDQYRQFVTASGNPFTAGMTDGGEGAGESTPPPRRAAPPAPPGPPLRARRGRRPPSLAACRAAPSARGPGPPAALACSSPLVLLVGSPTLPSQFAEALIESFRELLVPLARCRWPNSRCESAQPAL